jgi:hypothetical protein
MLNVMRELVRRHLLRVCLLVQSLFLGLCGPMAADEITSGPSATGKTESSESQGLDSAVLAEALDYVRTKSIPLHSFLIVRNGVVVLEAYFYPYTGREVHDVASVTKSFMFAAIGIAIDKGISRASIRECSHFYRPRRLMPILEDRVNVAAQIAATGQPNVNAPRETPLAVRRPSKHHLLGE